MISTRKGLFGIFVLMSLILLVVSASADGEEFTVVAGKVYTSDYSAFLEGASVHGECEGFEDDNVSIDEGLYALNFPADSCVVDSIVTITVSKDGYDSASKEGTVTVCDGQNICQGSQVANIAVVNPNLKKTEEEAPKTTSSGGGGGGGGSHTSIVNNTNSTTNSSSSTLSVPIITEDNSAGNGNSNSTDDEDAGVSRITGSFLGASGVGSWIIILVVLIVIIVAYVLVSKKSKLNAMTRVQ